MAAPDIYSDYYIMTGYGGWSPCIEGNNAYGLRPFPGSVLPNCVGYTVGRFNELLGLNDCTWLGSTDAKYMMDLAIAQGLQVGDEPVPGGIICWDSSADGHCAVIEIVIDNDTVSTTESGWNYQGPNIITQHMRYRVGGDFFYAPGYTYQGIIYPPDVGGVDLQKYYIMFLANEGVNYDRRKDF